MLWQLLLCGSTAYDFLGGGVKVGTETAGTLSTGACLRVQRGTCISTACKQGEARDNEHITAQHNVCIPVYVLLSRTPLFRHWECMVSLFESVDPSLPPAGVVLYCVMYACFGGVPIVKRTHGPVPPCWCL